MGNTFYGDLQGRFVATGWALFKEMLWLWLLLVLPLLLLLATLVVMVVEAQSPGGGAGSFAGLPVIDATGLLVVVIWGVGYPVLRAMEWKWWLSGIRFGTLGFTTTFKRRSVVWIHLKCTMASIGTGLLMSTVGFGILFAIVTFLAADLVTFDRFIKFVRHPFLAATAYGIAYLVIVLAVLVVQRFFLQHQIWRLIVQNLTVTGLSAAANVAARGDMANALGEGLADGLDVAGF